LLQAFAVVLKSCPEARLVLVGDGTEREAMMNLAANLGIDHAVRFTGYVTHSEVSRLVNAADIAVVPVPAMKQEMWLSPMKLFEYMASGKAIIASAMGQIVNVITDEQDGLLVPAANAEVLASAIHRLITDPALRARLGQRARVDAVSHHSWEQYLSQLEGIFQNVVNTSKAGQRR
jgi:glycosyltransferase involved in cell wall biosynthesis